MTASKAPEWRMDIIVGETAKGEMCVKYAWYQLVCMGWDTSSDRDRQQDDCTTIGAGKRLGDKSHYTLHLGFRRFSLARGLYFCRRKN